MDEVGLFALLSAILVLVTNLFSVPLEKSILTRPIVGLIFGVVLGPRVFSIITLENLPFQPKQILLVAAELTLIVSVIGVALRLPAGYFSKNKSTMSIILLLGMLGMCVGSAAPLYGLLQLPLVVAFLVAAILTPTDPVLASSIVEGKVAIENLPERLRYLLLAESGANDGLALPMVMFFTIFLSGSDSHSVIQWFTNAVLRQTAAAVLLGFSSGYVIGKSLKKSEACGWIERAPLLSTTVALSAFSFGLGEWLNINSVLTAFTLGLGFDRGAEATEQRDLAPVHEAINKFFTMPIFILFGILLPWDAWSQQGWVLLAASAGVLILRRMPAWFLLTRGIPLLKDWKELLFVAWFGPIGVAAIYYSLHIGELTGHGHYWTITSLIVFLSIIMHGASATPCARLMNRDEPDKPGA